MIFATLPKAPGSDSDMCTNEPGLRMFATLYWCLLLTGAASVVLLLYGIVESEYSAGLQKNAQLPTNYVTTTANLLSAVWLAIAAIGNLPLAICIGFGKRLSKLNSTRANLLVGMSWGWCLVVAALAYLALGFDLRSAAVSGVLFTPALIGGGLFWHAIRRWHQHRSLATPVELSTHQIAANPDSASTPPH